MPTGRTPAQAWAELLEGNGRFVRGQMEHPAQDAAHRTEVSVAQHPFAVILGCSDSRVAAEIVFDRGLGDLFVVRTAGHVVDTSVLGSIEYGVEILGAPLVVVLGHDSCGAVGAATEALTTGAMPGGFVQAVVERVIPSVVDLPVANAIVAGGAARADGDAAAAPDAAPSGSAVVPTADELGRQHVRHTVRSLLGYSAALRARVEAGRCAVVGLQYALAEGQVRLVESSGAIEA